MRPSLSLLTEDAGGKRGKHRVQGGHTERAPGGRSNPGRPRTSSRLGRHADIDFRDIQTPCRLVVFLTYRNLNNGILDFVLFWEVQSQLYIRYHFI